MQKQTLLFLELSDHGLMKLDFERYGRTPESYARRLNRSGRWAVEGAIHCPLIAWLPESSQEAEAAATRASVARRREVRVAYGSRTVADNASGFRFVLFERSLEPALLGYQPLTDQTSIRRQRDAEKLAEYCAAIARVFFRNPGITAHREAAREVAKSLTSLYGVGSVTSAIQWVSGRTGQASLLAVLCGEVELTGTLSISEIATICEYAKAGILKYVP